MSGGHPEAHGASRVPGAATAGGAPLRVLELIDESAIGGGQRHVLLLARGLYKRGVAVTVACEERGYLAEALDREGIPRRALSISGNTDPRGMLAVRRLCRAEPFDLVHTHGGTAGLWGRLGSWSAGVPLRVHTYHGLHAVHRRRARGLLLGTERLLSRITNRLICVARSDAELAQRAGLVRGTPPAVIRNGIDLERFTPGAAPPGLRADLGLGGEDFVIGTIGRLHVQKGHEHLIRAAAAIASGCPRARILLVGAGDRLDALRALARSEGVERTILFAGERTDAAEILRAIDLFVLPSLWEGLPLVLIEAAAAERPIVATAVDGNAEVVTDGESALLVPPADPRALAAAILRLAGDAGLRARLGEAARARVLPLFGADAMVEATLAVYTDAARGLGL